MRRTGDGRPEVDLATVVAGVLGFHDPGGADIEVEFDKDRQDERIMSMARLFGGGFWFTLDRTWLSAISPAVQALCTAAPAAAETQASSEPVVRLAAETQVTSAVAALAQTLASGVDGAAGETASSGPAATGGAGRACSS
jgi:hypothetical protein